jgi:hypothetical protein
MRRTFEPGRAVATLAALVALVPAAVAHAAPPADATSYFMAGNPHVPLAVVSHGTIRDAVDPALHGRSCGAPERWARRGSRWRAIDAWGKVLGTYAMDDLREVYDATGCIEEELLHPPPHDSTLLYVSADSPWREPASAEWVPTRAERTSLIALARRMSKGQSLEHLPTPLTEIAATTRFFEFRSATGEAQHLAVAGRCGGWLVAERVESRWSIVSREVHPARGARPDAERDHRMCFRPVAVFDMNGDGVPEIDMRFTEYEGEWWGEHVLQRTSAGTWVYVALSPGGSTA